MVKQYPHTLTYTTSPISAKMDEQGDWVVGAAGKEIKISCRAEPNGQGRYISGVDGGKLEYACDLYFPKGTATLAAGTAVRITHTDSGELIYKGTLIRFFASQLNARAWV